MGEIARGLRALVGVSLAVAACLGTASAANAKAWRTQTLDRPGGSLQAVSCPSARLCMAVGMVDQRARAGAREPRGDARRAVERLALAAAIDAEWAGVVRHRADGRVLQLENGVHGGRVCPRDSGGHDAALRRALGWAALVNPGHAARGGWLLQRGVVCGGGRLHGRWRIGLISEQREGGPDRTVEWITVADPAAAGDAPSGGVGNAHRRLMPGAATVHGGRRSLRSKRRQSARGAGRQRARLDEPAATTGLQLRLPQRRLLRVLAALFRGRRRL